MLAALTTGACAVNPVSGRPELVLVSAERERQLKDGYLVKVAVEEPYRADGRRPR